MFLFIWKAIVNLKSQLILSLVSGLVLTLAFPKIDMGWVAWIAMVPFLLAIRKADTRTGCLLGFVFGMAHNLGLIYWTAHTMHTYGHLPTVQAVGVLVLFAICLSGYQALFGATLSWLRPGPLLLTVLAPAAWVVLEILRARLFSGFPWALLGYTQYDHPWIIQMADLFGVYGISGLVMLANTLGALALLHWAERTWQDGVITRNLVVRGGICLAVALLCVNIYGVMRMAAVNRAVEQAPKAKVVVVQGNIDQAQKWDARFQMLTTVKYRRMSLEAAKPGVDLVIWPETAAPFYFEDDSLLSKMVIQGIQDAHAHFIIGSPSHEEDEKGRIYHNSAYLVNPKGKTIGKYDKVHLVPFGEYVPFKRWLPFIDKMVAEVGDFKPGRMGDTLSWPRGKVGMLICYEIIFPGLSRAMVQNGARLLVNITNDAWFGRTSAAYQHLSMAVLRTVENRRYLARAANTGISGFIDPNGHIVQATSLYTDTAVTEEVALLDLHTAYTRWGDWPLGLLGFGLLLPLLARKAKEYRPLWKPHKWG